MSVVERINSHFADFSKKERALAVYIVKETPNIAVMGITELAKATGISASTISRFVRTIGYHSFSEFRMALNQERSYPAHLACPVGASAPDDPYGVAAVYQDVIAEATRLIDIAQLRRIADAIRSAALVYIYGIGSSGLTATEWADRLVTHGMMAVAAADAHAITRYSRLVTAEDVAIALSVVGETAVVNQAIYAANERQATTVAITANPAGALARLADEVVVVGKGRAARAFVNTQFALMYGVDMMSTLLLEDA